jgi:hypothetical protein
VFDEAGPPPHGGGIGGKSIAESNDNGGVDAHEKLAEGAFGAPRANRTAVAGGRTMIGVKAAAGGC